MIFLRSQEEECVDLNVWRSQMDKTETPPESGCVDLNKAESKVNLWNSIIPLSVGRKHAWTSMHGGELQRHTAVIEGSSEGIGDMWRKCPRLVA